MHPSTTIGLTCALLLGAPLHAQQLPPRAAQPIVSMGQPPVWQLYGAGSAVVGKGAPPSNAIVTAGVHRFILNPVTGALGAAGELYSSVESTPDPGARLLITSPVVGLSAGIDWNSGTEGLDAIAMYQTAVRRGGLLGGGSMVRVDWRPSRHAFGAGIVYPLNQPYAGRTRPRDTDADLPRAPTRTLSDESRPLPAASTSALAVVAEAATLIRAYNNLYSDENERALLASAQAYRAPRPPGGLRYGLHYTAATRAYFEALAAAFTAAVNDSTTGEALTRRAREGALDLVILPYDSLFGQVKGAKDIRGLTAVAHARFTVWLRDSSRVAPAARDAVLGVHARWLDIISTLHDELRSQWGDTRLVWLPLQLVLKPEEYDEQLEVDALVARAIGRPFTDGNALAYLRSADLPMEIARSIFATRDYHVLWTHDFTGRRESGAIDDIGYSIVADAYFPALTRAVARYDSTGKMPVYMILVDQFYYSGRDGRLWMTILENPLSASIKLSGDDSTRADHLRQRQAELRAAVAASRLFQREAADHGGKSWLEQVVKVNVSVVYPSDFSFRSHRILPKFPFIPDNIMRDHRKIAFYDVNEADPYRGSVIVTGVGIGEHYASATWEDRGYRMSGPAALEVREAIRRALAANGIFGNRLPPPLRAVESTRGTEQRMNRGDYVGRALQVHNEVGFGAKESSVARAMLYNLASPGSVIIVPDPLWVSPTWAAMLAGAAARGCRVYIISPSLANGPNPQPSVAAAQHEVMLRLLQVRDRLGGQIHDAGGEMRIGLFTARVPVNDAAGRLREVREGLDRAPWIRQLIPFDASTLATLEQATAQAANGRDATSIAKDEKPREPQLHQKTQLIARPGALAALVRQPGWEDVLAQVMRTQSGQTTKFADQLGYTAPDVDSAATRGNDALLRGFEQARSDADRKAVSFYFSLGTQNQDPRGIMMDGETSVVVSGFHAAAGVVDLYFLMARTTWIEREADLDRLLPPPKGWMARLGKLFRFAL